MEEDFPVKAGRSDILTELRLLHFAPIPMKRPATKITHFTGIGALVWQLRETQL